MSRLLEKALKKVVALPQDEQDAIASQILASLADEDAWKKRFAEKREVIRRMASEALKGTREAKRCCWMICAWRSRDQRERLFFTDRETAPFGHGSARRVLRSLSLPSPNAPYTAPAIRKARSQCRTPCLPQQPSDTCRALSPLAFSTDTMTSIGTTRPAAGPAVRRSLPDL